jgi:predicted ATPase with chaperone activity
VPTIIALNCDDSLTVFDSKDRPILEVVGYDAKKIKEFLERVKKELI